VSIGDAENGATDVVPLLLLDLEIAGAVAALVYCSSKGFFSRFDIDSCSAIFRAVTSKTVL
jgi:hypothetical protein